MRAPRIRRGSFSAGAHSVRRRRFVVGRERLALGVAGVASAYGADTRFMAGDESAQVHSLQSAVWRAEDLERDYRKSGNEMVDAVAASDLIHLGRWHAFAQVQRAGAVRQDIIMVEHDFT